MEWDVTVYLKNGKTSNYMYVGKKEETRMDAYLSFSQGILRKLS